MPVVADKFPAATGVENETARSHAKCRRVTGYFLGGLRDLALAPDFVLARDWW